MFEKATVRGSIVAALRFSVVRFVSVVVAAVLLTSPPALGGMILVAPGGTFIASSGTLQNVTEILGDVTISGTTISGTPMALTKTGTGVLVLAGINTYTGGTILDDGTLVAANGTDGSATGSGEVALNGGILASDPNIGGLISGNVLPGSGAR